MILKKGEEYCFKTAFLSFFYSSFLTAVPSGTHHADGILCRCTTVLFDVKIDLYA